MHKVLRCLFAGCLCWALISTVCANEQDLFEDDWEARVEEVSEGELVWYHEAPSAKTPRLDVEIRLTTESLATGWVPVFQCHERLDPVSAADLVFTESQVRALRVTSHTGIKQAIVRDHIVELLEIGANAKLCVASEQKILHGLPEDLLALIAGPYKRRFLDGYYPQAISVTVHWPAEHFHFERLHPANLAAQAQFDTVPGRARFVAHVAGRLKFAFVFSPLLK